LDRLTWPSVVTSARSSFPERNWSGQSGLDCRGNLGCRVALGIGGMLAAASAEVVAAAGYSGNLRTTVPDAYDPYGRINTVAMLGQAYSLLGFRIVDGVVGAGFPQKSS
jgi:hypothetical protein